MIRISAHCQAALFVTASLLIGACSHSPTPSASPVANQTDAQQYLATVAAIPNVKKLSDQVYIKPIKQGYGCKPTDDSHVLAHYEARLANGTVVDSSIARGRPMTLPLLKTIKAWRLAVPQMNEGSTWEIYTHPDAAYGARGSAPNIPPNAPMAFTIQLIKAGTCKLQ